jgi:hypothetical protein
MSDGISDFINKVQGELNQRGASASLSIDEQDVADDFASQDLDAAACAERIIASRVRD